VTDEDELRISLRKISIIIPAYNEEERIKGTIDNLVREFPGQEIIVVCDGADKSRDIVKSLSRRSLNILLLTFDGRLGKGGALVQGFKAASGEVICFIDADESVSSDDLKSMFLALDGVDGVIASRRMSGSKILINQPLKRRFASKAFNIFVRNFFGLPFKDTQCGAKIFKRDAIYSILNEIRTTGFEIDVEILWRLKNKGYTVVEHPITWKHSEGSKFRLSHSKGMLISLLRTRLIR
jgi:glycosyltransferase involved in cell wall biosynthesis